MSGSDPLEQLLLSCPNVTRAERMRDHVVLVEVETVKGITMPLPGFDSEPQQEYIDRFTPWLDQRLRRGDSLLAGTVPKSYRLTRKVQFCDEIVTLHLCLPPRQWGILATLLSSPDRFAKRLVSTREYGGLLPSGWRVRDEGVIVRSDASVVLAPNESDFFAALSLPFVPRDLRK